MDPITAILSAAAVAGAIKGGARKHIDPEWLKANYGAHAVTAEAQALFSQMIHSPLGQSITNSASEAGQQFGRSTQAQAAAAGMTPMSGAATGTGIFATGAGEGAANALNSQAQGSMYQAVLPVAQQMVADRKQDYLNDFYSNGAPTDASRIWQGVGNAAGVALAAPGMSKPAIAPTGGSNMTTGAPITPVTSGLAAMASPPPQAAGMRSVAMNQPQMGFMQKAGRMLSGTTSRFAQALRGGSQPRFNYGY